MYRIHSLALAAGLAIAAGVVTANAQTPPPSRPSSPPPQTTPRDQADKAKPQASTMSADADFAHKAAMGGKHEVDGAKFAVNKATNADLKALANKLIKDHTTANTELNSLIKGNSMMKGDSAHGDMAMKDDAGKESWRSMSGAAFDRAYVDHLIEEHQKTITLFETEANSGSDAKLKAFANKTLPTLREHLKAAQDLKGKLGTTD
jgi:putative membrane protein